MTVAEHEYTRKLLTAVTHIAFGRLDCGRLLAAEKARQLARETLLALGEDWDTRSRRALELT